eukprot:TRINITY_DN1370_c1_g1_i1.p1 TRINITY_DN1370_c1_g1~~TRINITY_DN1370_c1_g1_i1.p1  ORF type:complete len:573 (+),score=100.90 TRINITY_DN1370_c1_g1_i1:182-1720(+)
MVGDLVEQTKIHLRSHSGAVAGSTVIDSDTIQAVISKMNDEAQTTGGTGSGSGPADPLGDQEVLQIYNVLKEVRPFEFNRATKVWAPIAKQPTLFGGCDSKSRIFADRYHVLLQRLLIEGKLVTEAQATTGALLPGQRVLTPVESLVGNPGRKLTFGLLSRQHDENRRRWVIEDLHKVFEVELEVQESDHLMTDGSFVLAEGQVVGNAFKVYHLDVAGAIPRTVSLDKDQVPLQAFGGSLTEEQLSQLERKEHLYIDGKYVTMSEVHLDDVRVLEKVETIFQGFENCPPAAYVLMGSFCSSAFVPNAEGVKAYQESFERLKFKMRSLENHVRRGTKFIFVPGPRDPGPKTLPCPPLPNYLTANLATEIPGVVMASNPCRIRHFSKELVFFRHDILRLLRRHEVVPLREPEAMGTVPSADHLHKEMASFLLDQAHLVPLPLEESNILWEYDHTLRLYPLPHAVFVGGVNQPFEYNYQECRFCSVGPLNRESSFFFYDPLKDEIEISEVPDRAG